MKSIAISKIEIDDSGRLLVYTLVQDPAYFQYAYRAAADVYWNDVGYFYSPVPREWSYAKWLEQIQLAVRGELGVDLELRPDTAFVSVSNTDERAMRLVGRRA